MANLRLLKLALDMTKTYPEQNDDVAIFISDLRSAQSVTGLPWDHMLSVIQARTGQHARKWFEANRKHFTDLTAFARIFTAQFGPTPSELCHQIATLRLAHGEDVRQYTDRFLATLSDLELSPDNPLALLSYTTGLGELGILASLAGCTTITEIEKAAIQAQGHLQQAASASPYDAHPAHLRTATTNQIMGKTPVTTCTRFGVRSEL